MRQPRTTGVRSRVNSLIRAWTALCLFALAGHTLAALTLSPTSVTLPALTYATVKISGASGTIQAESGNTAIALVTLTGATKKGATLNVYGVAAGATAVRVRDARSQNLSVAVTITPSMTVSPTSLSLAVGAIRTITPANNSGTVSATSGNVGVATVSVSANVVSVRGVAAGSTIVSVRDTKVTVNVPVTVLASTPPPTAGTYSLIAWNDLGMHCVDGIDYSVFSILPPFNNLHAQLVNATTGKAVTTGVTLTYEAVADAAGSINTRSASKTNFWSWVKTIYGATLTPDVGLTGNATPSLVARPMTLDAANGWFEATGLPITPYDDSGAKNFYPMVRVTARDSAGRVLATTSTVLPVSDEITCAACHLSRPPAETDPARLAARPSGGWVYDSNPETDWKKNILRLHDEKQGGKPAYQAALLGKGLNASGLLSSALDGKPALCAGCHASNALPGTGVAGIPALTSALHTTHGQVNDPATGIKLDDAVSRGACYLCHPGSVTKCLRGAMGNATNPDGSAAMGCQNCHGNMTKVGNPARAGWLQQPTCQACHFDGKRTANALDGAGNLVVPADLRFATNAGAPAPGYNLFRFSKGHGGMQCEACHGSTHAEYPSSHSNDNVQSIALQGYAGTVRECNVCHANPPLSLNGGPHGMHTIGAAWVDKHGDMVESAGAAQCAYCHGGDYRGSPLAQVKVARSYAIEDGRTRTYAAGQNVGCYDCHDGPHP